MSTPSHGGRISPSEVGSATFYVVDRGYDTGAVEHFLQAVAAQMEADLAQIEAQKITAKDETVKIISQAQILAEKFVAEAEEYSKDLVASARTQYSEILRRAEESAANRSESRALATTVAAPAYTTPIHEIEYVRTYTKVAQVQLRAVIDALAEQVDRLGDVPASRPIR
ncbi:DivIVA domain-containing protein [Arthrobacter sp. NPDC058192]|uniref:DivIVA domain-containing protein n=1 Tax=Arthrobacter sp. NPDC058192 TaxID=3346372 RepID=UPI0036EB149F